MNTRKKRFLLIGTLITILIAALLGIYGKKQYLNIPTAEYGAEIFSIDNQGSTEMSNTDVEQIRQLFNGHRHTREYLRDVPHFVIFAPSEPGQRETRYYSFYLDRQLIFEGYFLDARGLAMIDRKATCYTFTPEEKEQLINIVRKYPTALTDKSRRN